MRNTLRVGDVIGADECLEQIQRHPRLLFGDVAAHHRLVVDRNQPGLAVVADAFRDRVRKQEFEIRMVLEIGLAAVDQIVVDDVVDHRIELAGEHHRADVLVIRNGVDDDARRRLEAGRAAVAFFRRTFHPVFHVLRHDAEFMLQHAARPQRRGLLILRHANPLALEVGGLFDAGFAADQDGGVVKSPRRENRHADEPVVASRRRDQEGRNRHLGRAEFGEAELPPEQFGRMQNGRNEVDAVRLHPAVEDRPGARVVGDADAELKIHFRLSFDCLVRCW